MWQQGRVAAANVLYQNDGTGHFIDATNATELDDKLGAGWDAAVGDYDNDGDLDLFVFNRNGIKLYVNQGKGVFEDKSRDHRFFGGSWAGGFALGDYDNDGHLDIFMTSDGFGIINALLRNKGDGGFENVTAEAKIAPMDGSTLGSMWFDADNDGDLDLYVVNHHNRPKNFYRNNGDGTFTDLTKEAGLNHIGAGIVAVTGDYDNDGDLDMYLTTGTWGNDDIKNQPGVLYRNDGTGIFEDVTKAAGVEEPKGASAGAIFSDFDNDGYLDLYVTGWWGGNGVLYHNKGNGAFKDITDAADVPGPNQSWSVTTGDYDNDGDVDLHMLGWNGAQALYQNDGSPNNWLHINLSGIESNKSGIGARIKVVAGDLSMIREVTGGSAFVAKESLTAEFGLGENRVATKIEVNWPSGQVDISNNISGNQVITLEEGGRLISGLAVRPKGKFLTTIGSIKQNMLYQNFPNPFNPETWIPYRLKAGAQVNIMIYTSTGQLVRTLNLGNKPAGFYTGKSRAAYWDGRNELGETVASGIYYCIMSVDEFFAMRKMIITK